MVLQDKFTQKMLISSNMFLKNKSVDLIVKPNYFFNLAENIENVLIAKKPIYMSASQSNSKIFDLNNWYSNLETIRRI